MPLPDTGLRNQALFTLVLMPVTFGLWYAAGGLLVGPAVWLADLLLNSLYPDIVAETFSDETYFVVVTRFGEVAGAIKPSIEAGYGMAFKINTRLVSYSIPFYAALLWGCRMDDAFGRFGTGLIVLWITMAAGLITMAAKDSMLVIGDLFLNAPGVPHPNVIGVLYQFSVLLAPTLIPVLLWGWQLKNTPVWQRFSERFAASKQPD